MRILYAASVSVFVANLIGAIEAAKAADLSNVLLVQEFYPDDDPGQCNAGAIGRIVSPAGEWSPGIRLDTDNRSGGCIHRFALVDLNNALPGLRIMFNWFGDIDASQCGYPGARTIPINGSFSSLSFTDWIRIDTDDRAGGCFEVWSVHGRSDVWLEVDFQPDGDVGQCHHFGTHIVREGFPVSIALDMDGRAGGCWQRFRLRSN
jgi:hypothetical protein